MGDYKVIIDEDLCTGCGLCFSNCAYDVFSEPVDGLPEILNEDDCVGCLTCQMNCPTEAIDIQEN